MAQFSINDLNESNVGTFNSENSNNVSFFSLKSGEEAVVRIMIDDFNDFQLCTVHTINVEGKTRKISCLRSNPSEAISKCPLCESGVQLDKKLYIPMLQYVNENGVNTPKAVVWTDRSMAMAKKIKSYLENYGPLSNILCKIIRKGSGLDTEWEILPNPNPSLYKPELYPINRDLIKDYKAVGTIVMDKTYDEIKSFIATGVFPKKQNTNTQQTSFATPDAVTEVPFDEAPSFNAQMGYQQTQPTNGFNPQGMPWDNTQSNNNSVTRPTRTF